MARPSVVTGTPARDTGLASLCTRGVVAMSGQQMTRSQAEGWVPPELLKAVAQVPGRLA